MLKFIVDENLPYFFSIWKDKKFVHVVDIDNSMKDEDIWDYAKKYNLTIISKDADFSSKVMFNDPPHMCDSSEDRKYEIKNAL